MPGWKVCWQRGLDKKLGRSIGGWVASKRRNEGSQPGNFVFQVWLQRSGMALTLWLAGMTPVASCLAAWGACLVLGLEQAWLLAGFTGWGGFGDCLYLWRRYFHRWCFIFLCSGLLLHGRLQREADTDGWIFNPFIGAGDGNSAGSVAESWFCIITGLTLPILMGLSE
ncbi:MAG: hypothetical protein ACLR8P_03040 [Clostridium fessum]